LTNKLLQMSDKAKVEANQEEIANKAFGFWQKNSKTIILVSAVVIILGGGYLGYKNFIQLPNEQKASEELFVAESNFPQRFIQSCFERRSG